MQTKVSEHHFVMEDCGLNPSHLWVLLAKASTHTHTHGHSMCPVYAVPVHKHAHPAPLQASNVSSAKKTIFGFNIHLRSYI